jgi:hypothetical protein
MPILLHNNINSPLMCFDDHGIIIYFNNIMKLINNHTPMHQGAQIIKAIFQTYKQDQICILSIYTPPCQTLSIIFSQFSTNALLVSLPTPNHHIRRFQCQSPPTN